MSQVKVAAAIIQKDGKILAAKRADKGDGPSWEFPGGKIEDGEASDAAVRREIEEELGCKLQLVMPYDTLVEEQGEQELAIDYHICTLLPEDEPQALEHAELRWLSQDELLDVDWIGIDKRMATKLGVFWDMTFAPEHL